MWMVQQSCTRQRVLRNVLSYEEVDGDQILHISCNSQHLLVCVWLVHMICASSFRIVTSVEGLGPTSDKYELLNWHLEA